MSCTRMRTHAFLLSSYPTTIPNYPTVTSTSITFFMKGRDHTLDLKILQTICVLAFQIMLENLGFVEFPGSLVLLIKLGKVNISITYC